MAVIWLFLVFTIAFIDAREIYRNKDDLTSLFDQLEDDVNEIITHEKQIKKSLKTHRRDPKKTLSEVEIDLKHGMKTDILTPNGRKRGAGKGSVTRWPSVNNVATIPYVFDSTILVNNEKRISIDGAIRYMNGLTPSVQWVPRTTEVNYVSFQSPTGAGCSSYLGTIGGKQEINIGDGCDSRGIVAHEMMHCLGFYHEQSRPDRDEYVQVLWDNIIPGTQGNYEQVTWNDVVKMNSPYDYGSVMHYGLIGFSKNGSPTLKLLKPYDGIVGQRDGLSDEDISQLKRYYGDVTATNLPTSPAVQSTPSVVKTTPSVIETTPSVVDTTPSVVDTTPAVVDTTPSVVDTTPSVVDTTPSVVDTTPSVVDTTPSVVDTTPSVVETTPSVVDTTPSVVDTTPSVVDTTPSVVDTTPPVVDTTPSVAETTPSVVETTPSVVITTPTVVETTPIKSTKAPKCRDEKRGICKSLKNLDLCKDEEEEEEEEDDEEKEKDVGAIMIKHCKKSCNMCSGKGCKDDKKYDGKRIFCKKLANEGFCQGFPTDTYMMDNCRKTCEHCKKSKGKGKGKVKKGKGKGKKGKGKDDAKEKIQALLQDALLKVKSLSQKLKSQLY
ncbi:zinc metalloproteinase nas-14-like [Hydractinia symbiolongicarpus]|uniref:zinc metalloproteinase nas-14-like n=1 Tax=Hydractinia symbiolongicarpus TaxID=13093 RepID=UPI00254B1CF4|nr:zinc metalloproteinase nas-14-like [Hydractinia symbiolongicarpus]XP_057296063.1 zinc metalloproteinase nas-14-like [Hydractinia symbiolongicarpus]XP_057296064.1 zinc metalloproteinase nas-14-like [Hydractinia symbiolongicarpus]